jgi:hypothetical protein
MLIWYRYKEPGEIPAQSVRSEDIEEVLAGTNKPLRFNFYIRAHGRIDS